MITVPVLTLACVVFFVGVNDLALFICSQFRLQKVLKYKLLNVQICSLSKVLGVIRALMSTSYVRSRQPAAPYFHPLLRSFGKKEKEKRKSTDLQSS